MNIKWNPQSELNQQDEFLHLFKGKLIDLWLEGKTLFKLKLLAPINVNCFATGEKDLFAEITLSIQLNKIIIGRLNNSTRLIELDENESIFKYFKNRFFQSDFGHPSSHGVCDMQFPLFIDVRCSVLSQKNPQLELELVIPEQEYLPYIKVTFDSFRISHEDGEELKYSEVLDPLKTYYNDQFVNSHDRKQCDWEYLYGIDKSPEFYQNQLKQNTWFQQQLNSEHGHSKIDKLIGEMTLPCWIEVDPNSIQYDDYGTLSHFTILGATKRKNDLVESKTYFWLPPEDSYSLLSFVTDAIYNSNSSNQFMEAITLYFENWLPSGWVNKSFLADLKFVIESDYLLSKHSDKHHFLDSVESILVERNVQML